MNSNDLEKFKFSLVNALVGVKIAYHTQKNLRTHLLIGFLVIVGAIFLKISYLEWLFLLLTIMLVIITELFNTALEFAVDLSSPEFNYLAKKAKDVSAAGVLITSLFAVLIGLIIFIPKIYFLLYRIIYK